MADTNKNDNFVSDAESEAKGVYHDIGNSGVNPVQVQKFLKGIDYPCSKQELLNAAKKEGADNNVLQTLEKMPGEKFNSPNDVAQSIGELK